MIKQVLSVEFLKIRRKMVWFLVALGPLGVVGLQAVNFGLRYDYLTKQYADDLWGGLIDNVGMLAVPTLFVGLAILASMTAGIEHQTNAWKQTLALPVTRSHIFAGKFLLNVMLLFVSSTLLAAGAIALGACLGFALEDVPYGRLLERTYYPYFAVMPFLALQVWLSVILHNQAVPLTVGIAGTVFSMFSARFGDWMPYKWPYLINEADEPLISAASGIALGVVILVVSLVHFARKDVK
ncbi:ABC transporter permease [Paenibacillus thermoaerophilus]|uniref:ABC transporter permease n=1 Tax=Paenibacillus thermoaerophilus TaxID=1215385 RepID=A0ABW2UZM7_9BACL|nr:ABC transporter permease [Paenibacillus thermoaerophilus]TMV14321.1 permease [Paenibacillus thermoaerophilus]